PVGFQLQALEESELRMRQLDSHCWTLAVRRHGFVRIRVTAARAGAQRCHSGDCHLVLRGTGTPIKEMEMRVFVAGATGAIGKQLVPRRVAAGHEVFGMTRSESKQALLRER